MATLLNINCNTNYVSYSILNISSFIICKKLNKLSRFEFIGCDSIEVLSIDLCNKHHFVAGQTVSTVCNMKLRNPPFNAKVLILDIYLQGTPWAMRVTTIRCGFLRLTTTTTGILEKETVAPNILAAAGGSTAATMLT